MNPQRLRQFLNKLGRKDSPIRRGNQQSNDH
jgi:hypothetical protein